MQNSGQHSGRYGWTRVKSNRHKTNKRRDVSQAHLEGRFGVLQQDLEELGDRFPLISEKIVAEMTMISDELALRAAGKSKPSPVVPEWEPELEWGDLNSLEAVKDLLVRDPDVTILEDQCEIS